MLAIIDFINITNGGKPANNSSQVIMLTVNDVFVRLMIMKLKYLNYLTC